MDNSSKTFTVRLTMESDWHVGTGAGRPGSVDKLIARDAEGFPYVPAKTLNGIWRDAMETLTLGLDNGAEGRWSKFVELIFGIQPNQLQGVKPNEKQAHELERRAQRNEKTYSHSLFSIQPARLNQSLRKKINSFEPADGGNDDESKKKKQLGKIQRQKYLSALTFIKPGVAIDGDSGTARPDFLRFEEMGRVGTVLEAECELDLDNLADATDENEKTIRALLVTSAKLIERIGGKRRRGAGLCKLEVLSANGKEIEHLQSYKEAAPDVPNPKQQPKSDFDLTSAPSSDGWQKLEFKLTLRTPVSIVTATLGNVSESLDFIPGTYLLPHFTKVLGKQLGKEFFQAVAYGDFQVLPATLEVDGERGLPVPKVLAKAKVKNDQGEQPIYNRLVQPIEGKSQTKSRRSGFIKNLEPNKVVIHEESFKTLLMHNTVEDKYQRPTTDVGGVFSREAIAAGKILRGELRIRSSQIAQTLFDELSNTKNQTVRLGTSRKDDYGLVKLSLIKNDKDEFVPPKPLISKAELKQDKLTVYCESDVLLRNENLRQTTCVEDLAKVLGEELGVALDEAKAENGKVSSLIQTRRIESWHEGWGFPRPTLIAMAAGSCVVFKIEGFDSFDQAKKDEIEKALQAFEAKGLGERRGEGYGQIRFNPALLTQEIGSWLKADKPSSASGDNTASEALEDSDFTRQIEETVWREELKVAVLKIASSKEERKKIFGFDSDGKEPPMSQIGGLRSVITRLQKDNDKKLVESWLDHLKRTENRRKKWGQEWRSKITEIEKLIIEESKIWLILDETTIDGKKVWNSPAMLIRTKEQLQQKFWTEAVRALFDACARAHKRDLEDQEKKQNG
jgi:CRISPR-associated protein Csx10